MAKNHNFAALYVCSTQVQRETVSVAEPLQSRQHACKSTNAVNTRREGDKERELKRGRRAGKKGDGSEGWGGKEGRGKGDRMPCIFTEINRYKNSYHYLQDTLPVMYWSTYSSPSGVCLSLCLSVCVCVTVWWSLWWWRVCVAELALWRGHWTSGQRVVKQLRYTRDWPGLSVTTDCHGPVVHYDRCQAAALQTMEVHWCLTFDLTLI